MFLDSFCAIFVVIFVQVGVGFVTDLNTSFEDNVISLQTIVIERQVLKLKPSSPNCKSEHNKYNYAIQPYIYSLAMASQTLS